jgi:plasmid stability protein
MTLTIELTPEQEASLQARASAAGMESSEYVRQLLTSDLVTERRPMTGAEMIAYWEREGLIGSYGDPDVDAPELARRIRERAGTREKDAA